MRDLNKNNPLEYDKKGQLLMTPVLKSSIQKTTPGGIEMGVLENGMPYLSQRGVVSMAGIPRTTFQALSSNWASARKKGVGAEINEALKKI